MPYYIRILSTSSNCIPLEKLQAALARNELPATIDSEDQDSKDWEQILLSHEGGRAIASIERNLVEDGSLAAEEIVEFAEEIADCQPAPSGCSTTSPRSRRSTPFKY